MVFEKPRTIGQEDPRKSLERLNSVKRAVFEGDSEEVASLQVMTLQTDYHQNALPVKSTTGSMAFRNQEL